MIRIITIEREKDDCEREVPECLPSLRHTYISMRLMEGANIYQIARNCRTSVGIIERYYAGQIKNPLNAAAINGVRSTEDAMEEEEV